MRKRTFIFGAIIGGLLASGATSAARADQLDDIMAAKKIRVATDMAIPLSGMIDANMKPVGSDVEAAQLLAKDWGLELEFIETTAATRIPNLQTNKADIVISTLSVTEERKKIIEFSKPYAVLLSVIGGIKSSTVKDWPDLKGATVGVSRGTTQDKAITTRAPENGFTVTRYDDDATLMTAAISGQVDYVANSATMVSLIGQKNAARAFENKILIQAFDLAIGVRKGETRLVAKLDEWVSANLKNGKLNAIYKKYHGADLPAAMLN